MTSFKQRAAKHFVLIKAARQIRQEIEKAGLDNLKVLADAGKSIVGTYLNGCSPQEKAQNRRDFNALLQMGITIDMILDEVAKQDRQLGSIMQGRDSYRKAEIEEVMSFIRED